MTQLAPRPSNQLCSKVVLQDNTQMSEIIISDHGCIINFT
jgi:hypothetical protein